VASNFVRSLMGFDSRRAFRVLQFGAQIRLPFYLLLITVVFMSLFAWHVYSAYAELYTMVMTNVPESFQEQILRQTQDFSIVGDEGRQLPHAQQTPKDGRGPPGARG